MTGHATDKEDVEPEMAIDPASLTPDTFFPRPARSDASRVALEGRAGPVRKAPMAADEAMIAETEARFGIRLPETLRRIYALRDGGPVGRLYIPLVTHPRPMLDDWRGAFSIDYSSLRALVGLGTVADYYDDFTPDRGSVPTDARRLVILQARYGDMTLLDYRVGDRDPAVLLVDYDRADGNPTDVRFADFDTFLAALRRDRMWDEEETTLIDACSRALGDDPPAKWPMLFWNESGPHVFRNIARSRGDGWEPATRADDALLAEAEARLGVPLPGKLTAMMRHQNGGSVAADSLVVVLNGADRSRRIVDQIAPVEYWNSLTTISDRVLYPTGERRWTDGVDDPDRLIVLDAKDDGALLLDYRDGETPSLAVASGLAAAQGIVIKAIGAVEEALAQLRYRIASSN